MNPDRRMIGDMRQRPREGVTPPQQIGAPTPQRPVIGARPAGPVPGAGAQRPAAGVGGVRPKKRRAQLLRLVIGVLLFAACIGAGWYLLPGKQPASGKLDTARGGSTATGTASPATIRLLATGDWIAHDSVNAAAKQSGSSYNYLPLMNDFPALFTKADIRFCNDPILNGGSQYGISGYPKFNSPATFVTDMGKMGCNLANTASNHSFDFGQNSINASVEAWKTVPNMLAVAGENQNQQQHDTVHYFTMKGVKFAFLAYTTYINSDAPATDAYGVNVFSQDFAKQQISEARQNGAQYIIASMRWGTEYSTGVNAEQKAAAQFLADQGVGLVLGHGSHELQPVQQLIGSGGNRTTVWYSLGNFINTQEPPETLFNGLAIITIDVKTKQITTMSYLPIYMHYEWTAAQAAADNTNARTHVHLYLLEDATQALVDSQQLKTTIEAQRQRIASTLTANGLTIPLITSKQYLAGQ